MIDKSSLLKSQGSLYMEFISKDGLFHKMLLLSLMGFLTGWCNLETQIAFLMCLFNKSYRIVGYCINIMVII